MKNGAHYTSKVHVPTEFLGGDVVTLILEDVVIIQSMVKIDGEDVVMARNANSSIRGFV